MKKGLTIFFVIYAIILGMFAFTIIPNNDSYYYWGWSKNLQLSYFDGPPMIAYAIKLSTNIFGNSVFALNFVGVVVTLITTIIISEIVKTLLSFSESKSLKNGLITGLLWLTYPYVANRYMIVDVTYDCLVNLFDLTMLLMALKYIKSRNITYIYLIGVFAGLGLLSKYSSIIMSITLLGYFIYNQELRLMFRKPHVYIAILICFIIFMPVLIWNYQHQFASFIFQLKYHIWSNQVKVSSANNRSLYGKIWYYIGSGILGPMIIYCIIAVFLRIKHSYTNINTFKIGNLNCKDEILNSVKVKNSNYKIARNLILVEMCIIFAFWLLISPFAMVDLIYLLTFNSLIIIFVGYYLQKYNHIKIAFFIICIGVIVSLMQMIHYSMVPQCPDCYAKHIVSKELLFYSPFTIKYP